MPRRLICALVPAAFCLAAQARTDATTENLLIEKLEKVYHQLPNREASKVAVTLRLADLYAERARALAAEGKDSAQDRTKALRLYHEVIERAPEASRPKIVVQMGHLYLMNGQEDKAISFYKKNLSGQNDPQLLAEAHLSLAEIYFKRRDYAQAANHYSEVLKLPKTASRGLAAYRRAWCQFHLGKSANAVSEIEAILASPQLLARGAGEQIDPQFHEEVTRDYAAFLAKDNVTEARIEKLMKLSPEGSRVTHVQALAAELERLGKKTEALYAWKIAVGLIGKPFDRLAAQMSIAQLEFDQGNKEGAFKTFEANMQTWKDLGFEDSEVQRELKRRARNFAVSWHQSEKAKPGSEVLQAYLAYLNMFPKDTDVQIYATELAFEQKNWTIAWDRANHARELLGADKAQAAKLEAILLKRIEIGEAAKNPEWMKEAYASYLNQSPSHSKAVEVEYQLAKMAYDAGDFQGAAEALRAFAVKGTTKFHKQAADLALDALGLLKDESRLLEWSQVFAQKFPDHRREFTQVAQKTVLNRSATLAEADPAAALAALKAFDPSQSSVEDRLKYHRNRMILAEKQKQIGEVLAAADALIAIPEASEQDRELAWSRKAYFAEMRMDFGTALTATEKLKTTLAEDEKNLRLAMFAELSGRESAPFYKSYLARSQNGEQKVLVATELIRRAKNPEAEIGAYGKVIAAKPALHAELLAEVYAKTQKDSILNQVVRDKDMAQAEAGRRLSRHVFIRDFEVFKKSIAGDQMDSKSSAKLAQSIKRRAALLTKLEELAKRSIQLNDWTAQLLAVDLLAKQSERFYQDLLSAPMPEGLSPEEEQEYLNLLSAQAAPYQAKASEAKGKVEEFWKDANWLARLNEAWAHEAQRPLVKTEVEALSEIAPIEAKAQLSGVTSKNEELARPSKEALQVARQKVFENPSDRQALEQLLSLEKAANNKAMSEYLTGRLLRLNEGKL